MSQGTLNTNVEVFALPPGRDPRRLLVLVEVGLLVGTMTLAAWAIETHRLAFFIFSVAIFIVGLFAVVYLGVRAGILVIKRQHVYTLTEDRLVSERRGHMPIHIGANDVTAIVDDGHYLIVRAAAPCRWIKIPREVKGFARIRERLSAWKAITKSTPKRDHGEVLAAVGIAASLGGVLWSPWPVGYIAGAALGLVLALRNTIRLSRIVATARHPIAARTLFASEWLAIFAILAIRFLKML